MPGRGHEAAAKLADELKSNPSGPAGAAGGKAASNPLHPGLTQERLRAMEAEEEVTLAMLLLELFILFIYLFVVLFSGIDL